jgi:hypothetical protein
MGGIMLVFPVMQALENQAMLSICHQIPLPPPHHRGHHFGKQVITNLPSKFITIDYNIDNYTENHQKYCYYSQVGDLRF